MLATKLVVCGRHALGVFYPAGLRCPVCYPEHYPPAPDPLPDRAMLITDCLSYSQQVTPAQPPAPAPGPGLGGEHPGPFHKKRVIKPGSNRDRF